MRFDDFILHFDASSRGGFRARVLKSPFGEGVVGFSLPFAGTAPVSASGRASGPSRHVVAEDDGSPLDALPPREIGAALYHEVFQGQVRTLLDKSRGQLERSATLGLRLKIKIDPSDEETGALADLPWELLCDETEDFLALSRQTSIVRYLDVPRSSQPIPFTPPLRILAVGASPRGLDPLNLEEEMQGLDGLNRSSAGVQVQFLPHASAGAVRESLSGDSFNILHFMGHGTFDPTTGEGMLAFEAPDGSLDLVSSRAFATKLRDLRSLGVVMLNACDTARARHQAGANPFRGVATALVLGGVPAVVAMQKPISDRAAIGFSTSFYRNLARGDSIDEALTEGRQAIHSAAPDTFEWATPVLFLRIPEGNVFTAEPAARREEVKPPAPVSAPPPIVPAERAPAPSRRGPGLKIAAGAAGAALVAFAIYTKVQSPVSDPVPPVNVAPKEATPSDPKLKPSGNTQTNLKSNPAHQTQTGGKHEGTEPKPQDPLGQHLSVPVPVPPVSEKKPSGAEEIVAPTADLSRLSVDLIGITRRDGGGLRVTASFKNNADSSLQAILDLESSVLTDEQGQRYTVLDSDLSGSSPRLNLAAGASSRHTFDFQAPKVGSKRFYLTLSTESGRPLKVTGSPITLGDAL